MDKKNIIVGITGGIAAYKSAYLVSQLVKKGANVQVIMTPSACQFITPLTLQALSKNPVLTDTFAEANPKNITHISTADNADLVIIAPATANIIGKMANGIADDLLTTTLLAVKAPIFVAPAMNVNMYFHPSVQANIKKLSEWGIHFIEPTEGRLAEGYEGKGRMREPEEIANVLENYFLADQDLRGKRFLITAGATQEKIDPIRYLTNRSTGKMGYALAEAAIERGAEVILVSGKTYLTPPIKARFISVESAEEMFQAVIANMTNADVIIKAAAVADYRPKEVYPEKFKKTSGPWLIEMERTRDIALEVGQRKSSEQFLVGFAAESSQLIERAQNKLLNKKMNMIVANYLDEGFAGETNIATILTDQGEKKEFAEMKKKDLAKLIITEIASRLAKN